MAKLPGSGEVNRPGHYAVANAIGAAIAQVGGEVDRIFALGAATRQEILAAANGEAADKTIAAGARPDSVQILEVDEVPIAHLPGNTVRVRIKAVGDLQLTADRARSAAIGDVHPRRAMHKHTARLPDLHAAEHAKRA